MGEECVDEEYSKTDNRKKKDIISFAYYEGNQSLYRGRLFEKKDGTIKGGNDAWGENYRHHSSCFFKKTFLIDRDLFVDNYRHEDERFRMQCIYFANQIQGISNPIFIYRNNMLSVTHEQKEKIEDVMLSCIIGYQQVKDRYKYDASISKYCNDFIIVMVLELMERLLSQTGGIEKFNHIIELYDLQEYLRLDEHWLDDRKRKLYNDYKKDINSLARKQKTKIKFINKIKRNKLVVKLYEQKKYPLMLKGMW